MSCFRMTYEYLENCFFIQGASVLRMMRDILGHDHFIGAIRFYLKQHVFGNADEKDLWKDIQQVSAIQMTFSH